MRRFVLEEVVLISPSLSEMQKNDQPVKLGFLASGSGSNFEAIVNAIKRGELRAEAVQLVYNRVDAGVFERARRLGVAATLIDHRDYPAREAFDAALVQALADVDWVVMAGWMRISTHVLLDAFPDRILNIHPSLLPSFRGSRAVADAFEAGVRVAGCTVHIVRLEVDTGPIVAQAVVPRLADDTVSSLHARIHQAEHVVFAPAIGHAIASHA